MEVSGDPAIGVILTELMCLAARSFDRVPKRSLEGCARRAATSLAPELLPSNYYRVAGGAVSVRQGLLAILDLGSCFGFQLRAEFQERTGSTWALNGGQVFTTLERLERDGLVRRDADAGEQPLFSITDAGRSEVRAWLGSAVERSTQTRDELAVKLALAVTLPGVDVGELIQVQRVAGLRYLQELTQTKQASADPDSAHELAWLMTVDALLFAAESELRWLDLAEARIARAVSRGVAGPRPVNPVPARRGRPVRSEGDAGA